jgi:hypothetical protein
MVELVNDEHDDTSSLLTLNSNLLTNTHESVNTCNANSILILRACGDDKKREPIRTKSRPYTHLYTDTSTY